MDSLMQIARAVRPATFLPTKNDASHAKKVVLNVIRLQTVRNVLKAYFYMTKRAPKTARWAFMSIPKHKSVNNVRLAVLSARTEIDA